MTNQMLESMEDYTIALEELGSVAPESVDFRAAVPAGTELGATNLGAPGATAVWRKNSSGQRINGRELPDRIPLYNKVTGDMSMVPPTIAQKRITQRPHEFSVRKPEGFPEPTPIDETCEICTIRRMGVKRPFYSEFDLENHMQVLHPREFALIQRKADLEEKREDREQMRDLIRAVVGEVDAERPKRGRKAAE